jgi:CelD/BcsL family acetyltransferase involved in cellulose biosynthesis
LSAPLRAFPAPGFAPGDSHPAAAGRGAERVRVARTLEQVQVLRGMTEQIAWPHQDPEPEYFRTVLEAMPHAIRPHVVHLERPGWRPILVVARLERIELEARIGYLRLYRPTVRCLTVVHGGVAGAETVEDCGRVLDALRGALAAREADVVRFLGLRTDSPLYATATSVSPWLCRDRVASPQPHWRVAIPDSIDAFLAARSRNTRQNVKRYGRRFERAYRHRLTLRRFGRDDDCDLDRLFAELEAIAAKTYQRGLGVGFTGDELQRRTIELELRRGRYLAWVLDVDGVPSAFWDGSIHASTFFIGSPGYDPVLGPARVGTWLQMRMIEDLCARDDVSALDYGMGDAQYKRSFGDECWTDAIVHVFAPTLTGLRVNAARTAAMGATQVARRALGDSGLEQRVKRGWRRRLQTPEAT